MRENFLIMRHYELISVKKSLLLVFYLHFLIKKVKTQKRSLLGLCLLKVHILLIEVYKFTWSLLTPEKFTFTY